jgi:hypothetical protein
MAGAPPCCSTTGSQAARSMLRFASIPAAPRLYDHYFNRLDPWAAGVRLLGSGVVSTDQMLLPPDARRTEYFNDFAVHHDLTHLLTVVLGRHGRMNSVLSVLRGDRDQPFEADDQRFVAALVPHVQRALEIYQRIVDAQHERAVAIEALDAVRCAVFLVDAEATVLLSNRRGREMWTANDGLSSDRSRLSATDRHSTARLRHLCAAVATAQSNGPGHSGGTLVIERRSDRPPLQVVVAPARSVDPLGLHDDRIAALVFVSDPAD